MFKRSILQDLLRKLNNRQLEEALQALHQLHLLQELQDGGQQKRISLNDSFKLHFRQALTGG